MRLANSRGAMVIGIVNSLPSTIGNECDICFPTKAGKEIAVATTKGYTTQVLSLYLFALHIADLKKTLSDREIISLTEELLSIPEKMKKVLFDTKFIEEIAKKYSDVDNLFFIGRNADYATATEASLKLKEISYINCSAFPAGELKHGTIALIEKDTPVFAICANERLFKKTMSNIEEVVSRGADVICLSRENKIDKDKFTSIEIPDTHDLFLPLLEIIPMQLFAYYIAREKGCNIDMPKNLAKSVTVE
ncbi:MAG: SIS domain-containing protein, partial [Clostridia bacterium]|nr:SIS domain-containing protein [Clostridia bacterium]